ncbi:hypothetical protein [Clostridium sp. M62/1]|uniref:hypothetical protein n=1 Tax=Clostridium sp. M62/1 TaxID=411486 RepID=UPI003565783A
MDDRQKEAAERALHRVEMDELMKRIALQHREDCIQNVEFFGLPFRVLYSLNQSESQIPLSKFYPYRAARAETEEAVNEAMQREREQAGKLSDERMNEIRTNIESIDYTPADQREYYFTAFLTGWDFSHFKNWDWTGNRIPESEANRLRQYYTERQKMYMENPEKYAVPALIKDDDMGRYSPERQELLTLLDDLPDD